MAEAEWIEQTLRDLWERMEVLPAPTIIPSREAALVLSERRRGKSWLGPWLKMQAQTVTQTKGPSHSSIYGSTPPDQIWFDELAQIEEPKPKLSDLSQAVRWFLADEGRL